MDGSYATSASIRSRLLQDGEDIFVEFNFFIIEAAILRAILHRCEHRVLQCLDVSGLRRRRNVMKLFPSICFSLTLQLALASSEYSIKDLRMKR